ncbi:MAG: hypothetical protein GY797_03105 [Deltaproteobacteria bacterium]|nr:hypothetical protein [Deltaproteobacteria bacterium]
MAFTELNSVEYDSGFEHSTDTQEKFRSTDSTSQEKFRCVSSHDSVSWFIVEDRTTEG